MNQADENGSGSKPGKLPTTEHNRKGAAAWSDEAALAWLRERSPIEVTKSGLARDWRWDDMKVHRRLLKWQGEKLLTVAPAGDGKRFLLTWIGPDEKAVRSSRQPSHEASHFPGENLISPSHSPSHPDEKQSGEPQKSSVRSIEKGVENLISSCSPPPSVPMLLTDLMSRSEKGRENPLLRDEKASEKPDEKDGDTFSLPSRTEANVLPFRRPIAEGNLAREIRERTEELKLELGVGSEAVQPNLPVQEVKRGRLPFFRPANGLRLVATAAVGVSISMIAYHSATASAASAFHWWATLAMAVIISTGKVELGRQAEGFLADGARNAGLFCMAGALFLLCVDASLLYAFRGDSLSNAAAMEKAAMESRTRVKTRLDGLMAEQQRLATGTGPAAATDVRLVAEVEADLRILESVGDCRQFTPKATRRNPSPQAQTANPKRCETTRGALAAELARAKDAAGDEARSVAAAEKREKRLAELPDQIAKAEIELGQMQARATPDHGASIVARGLNWIPAGVSSVLWGEEIRPVEGRGVEIFWSWAFVLAAELFAVGGFAIAARADRKARMRA